MKSFIAIATTLVMLCGFGCSPANSQETTDVPVLSDTTTPTEEVTTPDPESVPTETSEDKSWWQKVKDSAKEAYDSTFTEDEVPTEEEGGSDTLGKPEAQLNSQAGIVATPESSTEQSTSSVQDKGQMVNSTFELESVDIQPGEDNLVYIDKTALESLMAHYSVLQNQYASQTEAIESFCFPKAK